MQHIPSNKFITSNITFHYNMAMRSLCSTICRINNRPGRLTKIYKFGHLKHNVLLYRSKRLWVIFSQSHLQHCLLAVISKGKVASAA